MSRINQFFNDVFAQFYALDYTFLARYLNESESEFIGQLRKAELLHVVQVAKKTLDALPKDLAEAECTAIIKAVLLHDVGKYHYAMGPIAKTMMVLFGKGIRKNPEQIKKHSMVDVYQNHGQYSWEVVRDLESFPDHPYLYDLIRFHHEPDRFVQKYGLKEQGIFWIYKKADDES